MRKLTNRIMMAALAVTFITGICIHPLGGTAAVKILHTAAGFVLVCSVIAHVWQNRKRTNHGKKKETV